MIFFHDLNINFHRSVADGMRVIAIRARLRVLN